MKLLINFLDLFLPFVLYFHRKKLMRDTEHLDGRCGMSPHDNEIWQQTPRHWKPEYQTQYNIERWLIWGQKPWRNPRFKDIRIL